MWSHKFDIKRTFKILNSVKIKFVILNSKFHSQPPTQLSEAMGKSMEDMTATASGKLKQRYGSSPSAIFTFVASLVRTNLECELVQRGGTMLACDKPRYKPRNECIG